MENAGSVEDVITFLQQIVAEEIKEPVEGIDIDMHFYEFGFDSISSLYLLEQIEQHFKIQLNQLYFWDFPTIRGFAQQVFEEQSPK